MTGYSLQVGICMPVPTVEFDALAPGVVVEGGSGTADFIVNYVPSRADGIEAEVLGSAGAFCNSRCFP